MAGLLAGLPALYANGLLSGIGKHLSLPKGFHSALHLLLSGCQFANQSIPDSRFWCALP